LQLPSTSRDHLVHQQPGDVPWCDKALTQHGEINLPYTFILLQGNRRPQVRHHNFI
jgi:hypothetical protein